MIHLALLLILLLELPRVRWTLARVEIRRDGVWWVTWYSGGHYASRVLSFYERAKRTESNG
jgi:hypothetical protein